MNKKDVLEQKLRVEGHLLNSTGLFTDAPMDKDIDKAMKWIESKYIEIWNKKRNDELKTFVVNSMSPISVQETFDMIFEDTKKSVDKRCMSD